MPSGPGWGGNQLERKGAQSGFVLEGVRGDYSGSMSVFPCRGMFRRLAAMGPLPRPTGGIQVKAENSRCEHGEQFREMAIQEAWNKQGHKVTVSSDGCGSMAHLRDTALDLGIDHSNTISYMAITSWHSARIHSKGNIQDCEGRPHHRRHRRTRKWSKVQKRPHARW